MKRSTLLAALCAILAALVATPAHAALVENGGFADDLNGWTQVEPSGDSIVSLTDASRDTDGDTFYGRMISTNVATENNGHLYQIISVVPGETYTYSFDARRNGSVVPLLRADVFEGDVSGTTGFLDATTPSSGDIVTDTFGLSITGSGSATNYATAATGEASYTTYTTTFTPTSELVTIRFWDNKSTSSSSDIWIDNVQLNGTAPNKIIAHFTGGNGTDVPDQYKGSTGDGWASAWDDIGTISATVVTTSELDNGGRYLQVTSAGGGEGVNRRFGSDSIVDTTSEVYTVEANLRIDSAGVENMQFGVRSGGTLINTTTDVIAWARVVSGVWSINDDTSFVSTGIEAVTGHVYHLALTIDPINDTHDFWIDDLDDAEAAVKLFGLDNRNTATVALPYVFAGPQTGGDATAFSLDRVIASVPTPMALPAGLALFAIAAMRRRHN